VKKNLPSARTRSIFFGVGFLPLSVGGFTAQHISGYKIIKLFYYLVKLQIMAQKVKFTDSVKFTGRST